ncbi:hypothetical protein [Microbacterium thalassium]|uniref:PqqD family protein n=1 Tax=Microbacterium thalassium TaxID=362649 RepID=A0A7X0KTA9_9MICO|nr:hypothetical protein [Microbacterium thalassium]MBB6389897.1 hypothetical protein [Microbacterium thalassium]GLK24584.1 hypothetical protein GCM10017607_19020 [Microbacterium thalassium]
MSIGVAPSVGVEIADDAVYAAALPDGPIIVLRDSAQLIWQEAVGRERDQAIAAIAGLTGEAEGAISGPFHAFVDELVALGLLRED